jgi:hypothetical protein
MAVQYAFSQITTQGLRLAVDAADPLSYPGSGTVLTDVSGNGFTGNVSSSISFAVTNRGALFSPNSSSAITFSGLAADFGSGSFTMEMAFTPQTINGQHFLYSKNSGSFPNFGAFLTGSNGSGRLVAFYNISSTISCSASTPTGSFVTGSNYIVDVTYVPSQLATAIYTNSNFVTQAGANGTGSLSTSASLFLLNNSTSSNVGSVANLYNFKVYNPNLGLSFIRKNYNAQAARFGLPLATYIPPAPLLLDAYSGAAAAYSLRKLRTSYSGAAIRVRRSSDNAEADIGFNVNGELDTIALLTFCGAGDGFVKTWYDQSGNGYDAAQATASRQPQIVSSGNVITLNSKPTVQFTKSRNDNLRNIAFSISGATTFTWVGSITTPVSNWSYVFGIGTYSSTAGYQYTPNTYLTANDWQANDLALVGNGFGAGRAPRFVSNGPQYTSGVQALTLGILSTTTSAVYKNNSLVSQRIGLTGNVGTNVGIYIGTNNFNEALPGNIQELIFWNSDQNSNLSGINTNTNDFYSIY